MATQAFKKKIYEVKVWNDFVLQPNSKIENQIRVSYLNSIYILIQKARISNYLDGFLFLIANMYREQNIKLPTNNVHSF